MELNNDYSNNLQYSLDKLKYHQQQEVLQLLNQFLANNNISPVTKSESHLHCPECSSNRYVKNGMRQGKQKYKCKECGLSFTSTSNTAIHFTRKIDIWTDFVYLMFKSSIPPTLQELSDTLKISTKTAHEWKHKLLASLNELDKVTLRGVVEMDEVFLPFCVKGKRGYEKTKQIIDQEDMLMNGSQNSMFLCIHNRDKDFDFLPIKIQQKGAVRDDIFKPVIDSLNIEPNTIVVTDKSKNSTKYFATRNDIRHEIFISSGEKTSVLHNNNINSTMNLYRKWSNRFNGYSTKYVWNYLKWFRYHRKFIDYRNLELIVDSSVKDTRSFNRYVLIPKYYEKFLFSA